VFAPDSVSDLLLFAVTGGVDVPLALRGAVWGYVLLLVFSLFVYGHVAETTQ